MSKRTDKEILNCLTNLRNHKDTVISYLDIMIEMFEFIVEKDLYNEFLIYQAHLKK